jgi:hypothetical protein
MGIVNLNKKEEEAEVEPRKAQLIGFDGGKGDGEWLTGYPLGTQFLAEIKKPQVMQDGRIMPKGFTLQVFQIVWKGRRGVRLMMEMPDGSAQHLSVNPIIFCQNFDLYEIIMLGEEENDDNRTSE